MGWRTKHKNVIDPLFLGLLEQMIQDISGLQIDPKLPQNLWPDRPSTSVPSIFRKRKFIEVVPKVTKRGRPKKTEAEQRLPLKKRHLKMMDREKGRISRKTSTDENHKKSQKSAESKFVLSQNGVNAKNIVDSIAACVDKYTKKDFTQPLTVSIHVSIKKSVSAVAQQCLSSLLNQMSDFKECLSRFDICEIFPHFSIFFVSAMSQQFAKSIVRFQKVSAIPSKISVMSKKVS